MTAICPPRWMQRLLGAIGADAEFRDDVLGDMADELAIRAAYDGEREARAWYVREGMRALPYLVRNWWTCGRRAGIGYLAPVILQAYLAVGLAAVGVWCSIASLALAGLSFAQIPNTMPASWIVSEMLAIAAGTTLGGMCRVVSARSDAEELELT